MKTISHLLTLAFATNVTILAAQDALTMQDINFNTLNYNTAFMAEKQEIFGASLTNTSGGGIQNTGQVNFLAYTQIKQANLAVGVRVNSKYFGLFRTSNFELNAAKRIQLNSTSAFMAGMGVGMQFTSLRSGELNEYVDQTDPMLVNGEFPQYRFVFSFGLAYAWKDKLRAGIAMPAFAKTESNFNPVYIANVSYNLTLENDLDFLPELLLIGSDINPVVAELNVRTTYQNQVWLKLGYRSNNTFVGGIGVNVKGIEVGYAYNAFFQEFKSVIPSTHNINLTFRFSPDTGAEGGRKYQLY